MKRNATMILFSLLAVLFSFAPTQVMAKKKTCTLKIKMNNPSGKKAAYVYRIKAQRKGGTFFGRQKCFTSRNGHKIKKGGEKTVSCKVKIRKSKSCNSKWKIFIAWAAYSKGYRNVKTDSSLAVWKQPSNGQLSFTLK